LGRLTGGGGAVLRAGAFCAALLAWDAAAAAAHAIVLESEPAADAKLLEPPTRISLRFNSKIEKRLSHVTLADADGRPVPLAAQAGDGEKSDRIVLSLGKLRPGEYRIRYKVLAADGHITEGALRFTVLEPK